MTAAEVATLPPYDEAAERAALGCVLLAGDSAPSMLAELRAADFFDLRHRAILQAAQCVATEGAALDVVTLTARLTAQGSLAEAGGIAYVTTLPDAAPVASAFPSYLPILRDFATRRELLRLASKARELATDPTADLAGIGAEFAETAAALISRDAETQPPRPWIDVAGSETDILVGPGRWLTRGSGILVIAPTGAGKSTWCATQSFAFALGRPSLGFVPARPLRSLLFQSEDDDGDLELMRRGTLGALAPTAAELAMIRENVLIVTERARTGLEFLRTVLAPSVERVRPDLVWINPLSAFFGDDLNAQLPVARFFRNTLNPILARFGCGNFSVHHTAKPSKDRKAWQGSELAYAGAGSSDLANWSRDTLTLREVRPGLFEMVSAKRWRHLGWRDAEGRPTAVRMIAHGKGGAQVWRDVDAETLEEIGADTFAEWKLVALVPPAGIDRAELTRLVTDRFAVSTRTAQVYVAGCLRVARRMVDGKPARIALLAETLRPRKEVYPDSQGGRPVSWITRKGGDGAGVGAVMAQPDLTARTPTLAAVETMMQQHSLGAASSTSPGREACGKELAQ